MRLRRFAPLLTGLLGGACAATPIADPAPLTHAAASVSAAAAAEGARLRADVLAALEPGDAVAADAASRLSEAEASWQRCAAAWIELEQHGARLEPLLARLAYDPRGARPAADSWRRLALGLCALGVVPPRDFDAMAREFARAGDATQALRAASPALEALAVDLESELLRGAAELGRVRDALDASLHELESGRQRRNEALAALIARAEEFARMEAAGAGRAPAEELRHLAADRAEQERVLASLADAAARRAAARAAFDRSAERMRRAAHASRAWAAAHAELTQALDAGEPFQSRGLAQALARLAQDA